MDELKNGERQVAPSLDGIRADHRARYEWAAKRLPAGSRVIDLACGIGYGAFILAEAGHHVEAFDRSEAAIAFANAHYGHKRIRYEVADATDEARFARTRIGSFDAAVSFETIEHLEDPLPMLSRLRKLAPVLLASVPNEAEFPFRCAENNWQGWTFHHRHYTVPEFGALLAQAGWEPTGWHGQAGPESPVTAGATGRTLVVEAEAKESTWRRGNEEDEPPLDARQAERLPGVTGASSPVVTTGAKAPDHVAILGLGPSLAAFIELTKRLGGTRPLCDEVWGINAVGGIVACDRVFHMDDIAVQELRASANPDGNVKPMLEWLRRHTGPIYTSTVRPGYPGLVEFPLADVITAVDEDYFNSTAAYAVGFAIHLGVKRLTLFGLDFTYPNQHGAERGRGCVEFLLGIATARGIKVTLPHETSLMDACEPPALRLYGYDAWTVTAEKVDGRAVVTKTPKPLPTAAEIEARYDHRAHPNPHLRGQPERVAT